MELEKSWDAVFQLESTDPFENLARETLLLQALPPGATWLVLYVNAPCVVMGRHQNPLRELRLAELAQRQIPVVRRGSGGGTVWHDEGNLNYAVLSDRQKYQRETVFQLIQTALHSLGIELSLTEKGDLLYQNLKVSGTAYAFRKDRVLHHGTLLCQAQLDQLRGVLGPTGALLDWVGVASRPMSVTNLGLSVEAVRQAVAATFARQFPQSRRLPVALEDSAVAAEVAVLRSPQWLWQQTPAFQWQGLTRQGPLHVRVEDGTIRQVFPVEGADKELNMSKLVGKDFFSAEFFEYFR